MKPAIFIVVPWRINIPFVIALLILFSLSHVAQGEPSTNKWPSLAEIRKKWDNASLDAIKLVAENGDLTAQHYLGYAFASGQRVATNGTESLAWYERALRGGYLPAANNLGLLYLKGLVVTQDLKKAVYYTRIAADGGLGQAQANMGHIYHDGTGVRQDYAESVSWFRRAAEQGHTGGMVGIGRACRFGQGLPKDIQQAIKWFQLASHHGDPLGTLNLGLVYGYEPDAPQDQEQAFKLYRQAADQGEAEAIYQLYLCYKNGNGVIQNEDEANRWLTKAAEEGNPVAQCERGYNFEFMDWNRFHELSNSNDMPSAISWYRRSANQGCPGGQYHLGLCYLAGKGVDWDEVQGLELIRKAADAGHSYALEKLAELYRKGIGEPRDENDRPSNLLLRVDKK